MSAAPMAWGAEIERAMDAQRVRPEGMRVPEIMASTGKSRAIVMKALHALHDAGRLAVARGMALDISGVNKPTNYYRVKPGK